MNNFKIKPIETIYKEHRFRSRLEARWAVFFDTIGITWVYEPEGYELNNGQWYLPDFYLPTFDGGTFCEVKPDGGDFSKAKTFVETTSFSIWLCEGVPDYALYKTICMTPISDGFVPPYEAHSFCGYPLFDQAIDEDRMFVQPCYFEGCEPEKCSSLQKIVLSKQDKKEHFKTSWHSHIVNAVKAAKSARFEYGENTI